MNNLNKNIAITALLSTSFFFSGVAMAAEGVSSDYDGEDAEININEDDEITLSFNQPQSLAVSAPNNEVNRASGGIITKTWHIVSNNAVGVRFTGKAPNATGTETNAPTFYKAEVDASGTKIETSTGSGVYNYDHLVTTYGVSIADQGSASVSTSPYNITTTTSDTGTVSTPTGSPANLVLALDTTNGPDAHFGSIMPDDNGRFTMTLSAKGVGDVATTQSGDYQVTIVASFVAEEKGNGQITAATTAGLLTSIDTYGTITSTTDDNSAWNDETSTSTLDTEQSPDVLSTTDGDDTSAANATIY
jgi:hypothetical protein